MLPDIDIDDIRALQNEVPELLVELSLNDSMEQSLYVKEKLSQKNLSKLCDPKSNPKLVETLRLRELTGTNGIPKMTVSQLQKEISQEDIALDLSKNQMNWQLGESAIAIPGGDFEPSSLKTLPSEFDGLQSSQSSEISDSLFRSAEGLEEVEVQKMDLPNEMVGILDLSEEPDHHGEEGNVVQMSSSIHNMNLQYGVSVKTHDANDQKAYRKKLDDDDDISNDDDDVDDYDDDDDAEQEYAPHIDHSVDTLKGSSPSTKQISEDTLTSVGYCRLLYMELKEEIVSFCFEWNKSVEICKQNIMDGFTKLFLATVQTSKRNRDLEYTLVNEVKVHFETLKKMNIEFEKKLDAVEGKHFIEIEQLETNLKNDFENYRKEETEKWQESLLEMKEMYEIEKSSTVAELSSELKISHLEIEKLNEKNDILNEEIETLQKELETKEKQHHKEVHDIMNEKENAENLNLKMKEEVQLLGASKNQLEAENQKNFNSALKQVKKEKDTTIKELQMIVNSLKNDAEAKEKLTEKILAENGHYKEINSKIMNRIEALENDKEKLEMSCNEFRSEISKLESNMESERIGHSFYLDRLKDEMENRLEREKLQLIEKFEAEKSNLKEESSIKIVKLIEDFKKQRNALKEESEKEKVELTENLKREKEAFISSLETEKQKFNEEFEKQQSLSKESSIE